MGTALLISAGLLGFALLLGLWVQTVRFLLRMGGERPAPLEVLTSDGWKLTAWHRPARTRRYLEPVVLCHGLANNHRILEFQAPHGLAAAIAEAGFECFTVDLRGARRFGRGISVDDHIQRDVPALIDFALAKTGAKQAFWVGHSLGGLVALGAAEPALQAKLKGLLTIGSPVFFRLRRHVPKLLALGQALAILGRIRLDWLAAAFAPLAGWIRVPLGDGMGNQRNIAGAVQRRALAGMIAPVSRGVIAQLRDWAVNDQFRSVDRQLDYRQRIAALTVPHLVVGGEVDLLAPPQVCREHFALAGSPDKQLLLFGRPHGHQADYGHGDLLIGVRAHEEVYPPMIRWLEERATRLPVASS